jgi:hypothetical protein
MKNNSNDIMIIILFITVFSLLRSNIFHKQLNLLICMIPDFLMYAYTTWVGSERTWLTQKHIIIRDIRG